jgi:hypothetical protein
MSRLSLAGGLLLLLVSAGAVRAELACSGTPFAAGEVATGNAIRHAFTLVNTGSSTIDITEVKPGCGCLRPHIDRPTLQPGEQATLLLEINTLTQAAGPNIWRAVVHYTENGKPGELIVHVRADLVALVSVSPAALIIHTQTAARGEFTLTEQHDPPLPIRAVVASSPHLLVTCGAASRESGAWKRSICVDVQPSMPEGRHEDVLRIYTADSRYEELTVPFTVVKRSPGRVDASPASLSVLSEKDGGFPSRIVMLGSGDDRPVVVERVETSDPFIVCTWAAGPNERSTLRVQFDSEQMPAKKIIEGAVRVHLREPMPQVVTIPIMCNRP